MEIWKDIEETNYEISNRGRVKNKKTGKLLRISKTDKVRAGFYSLRVGKKYKVVTVAQLVANAFIPNPLNLKYVNRISSDLEDNQPENFERSNERKCFHGNNIVAKKSKIFLEAAAKTTNLQEIAEETGFSYNLARKYKKRLNVDVVHPRHATEAVKEEARKLKKEGWSYSQLVKHFGFDVRAIYRWIEGK